MDEFLLPYNMNGGCDVIGFPGGVKDLLDDQKASHVLDEIRTYVTLHGLRHIMLINHRDCGAYGGSRAFASREAERHEHERDLRKAAEILHKEFPEITVGLHFAESGDAKDFKVEPIRDEVNIR